MAQWDYKFVKAPRAGVKKGLRFIIHTGETFESVKAAIPREARDGWRLKQVVVPFHEKKGVYGAYCYQIIFEREIKP